VRKPTCAHTLPSQGDRQITRVRTHPGPHKRRPWCPQAVDLRGWALYCVPPQKTCSLTILALRSKQVVNRRVFASIWVVSLNFPSCVYSTRTLRKHNEQCVEHIAHVVLVSSKVAMRNVRAARWPWLAVASIVLVLVQVEGWKFKHRTGSWRARRVVRTGATEDRPTTRALEDWSDEQTAHSVDNRSHAQAGDGTLPSTAARVDDLGCTWELARFATAYSECQECRYLAAHEYLCAKNQEESQTCGRGCDAVGRPANGSDPCSRAAMLASWPVACSADSEEASNGGEESVGSEGPTPTSTLPTTTTSLPPTSTPPLPTTTTSLPPTSTPPPPTSGGGGPCTLLDGETCSGSSIGAGDTIYCEDLWGTPDTVCNVDSKCVTPANCDYSISANPGSSSSGGPCTLLDGETCSGSSIGAGDTVYCEDLWGTPDTVCNVDSKCVTPANCDYSSSANAGSGCTNSCTFAYDGYCDEPSLCDSGTDCYDCT
jgi:hypothetical protein